MLSKQHIQQFLEPSNETRISILGPTHRYGHKVIQRHDALTLKTNLKEARQRLKMQNWEEDRIQNFLQPAKELLEDDSFWPYQSDGLAIFLSESEQQIHRLPVHFENMVYLGNEFYIKPLSPLLGAPSRFFILCLSQNKVAFYEATAHSITAVKIDDLLPMGRKEMDEEKEEKVLQLHSAGVGHTPHFHGHGSKKDKQEVALEKYLRAIDEGLMKMLHDENPPLVFAGVDELFASYKQINSYPHLVDENISGNPFSTAAVSLQEHAWEQVKFHFDSTRQTYFNSYNELRQQMRTSTSIDAILRASMEGRVECIFTRDDRNLWGSRDPLNRYIQIHPLRTGESQCLLNAATIETLRQGGKVYNVPTSQMPVSSKAPIAAIFRY